MYTHIWTVYDAVGVLQFRHAFLPFGKGGLLPIWRKGYLLCKGPQIAKTRVFEPGRPFSFLYQNRERYPGVGYARSIRLFGNTLKLNNMGFLKHLLRGSYGHHSNKHQRKNNDPRFNEPKVVVRCTKCGKDNPENASFCQHYGEPLGKVKCISCQEPIPMDAKFCSKCGNEV